MKKYLNFYTFLIVFVILLIIGSIFMFPKSKTVDCSGRVDEIEINSEEEYVLITIHESIDTYDYTYKIEIPFNWKCKDGDGKKFSITDIKIGDSISLNFNGSPESKDGILYVTPKGTITVR